MSKKILPVVAKRNIQQALQRLGSSFLDAMNIVEYKEDIDTACWIYDQITGKENICVGYEIAKLDISSIEMVLRHEFLHRATYNGFQERFQNKELLNIVEDICINRLLFEAYPDKMEKLSLQVYSHVVKKTIIALADCTADSRLLDDDLANLWSYIWERDEQGLFSSLNPASLYYRLLEITESKKIKINIIIPFFSQHHSFPTTTSRVIQDIMENVVQNISDYLPAYSSSGSMINTFLMTNNQLHTNKIKSFIQSLRVDKITSNTINSFIETIKCTVNNVFPMIPSRRGLLYLVSGISESLAYYNNIQTETNPYKQKLCFYVDVSGSMSNHFSHMHHFIKELYNIPIAVRIFDHNIKELSMADFENGRFRCGGGTDFNNVIQDLLNDSSIDAGLLFTDGEANISFELRQQLLNSHKKIFVVYFIERGNPSPDSVLDQFAEKSMIFEV